MISLTRTAALFAGLAVFALLAGQSHADDDTFDPSLPHFEIKVVETDDGPETRITRHEAEEALSDEELKARLLKIGNHVENENGWKGRAPDTGVSENPVVVHVEALANATKLEAFMKLAKQAKLAHVVVGIDEYVDKKLTGRDAPDVGELPDGYTKFELPKENDVSSEPSVPKEQIEIVADWDARFGIGTGSYLISQGSRGQRHIRGSGMSASHLTGEDTAVRDAIQANIKKAAKQYIASVKPKVEACEIISVAGVVTRQSAPWAMVDLIGKAIRELNDEREENGQEALEIEFRWNRQIVEPPPPEQPPEDDVKFPQDESKEGNDGESDDSDETETTDANLAEGGDDDRPEAKGPEDERVKAALDWLRDHQNPEGYWSATDFDEDSKRGSDATRNIEFVKPNDAAGDEGWKDSVDIGLTGLALMAFARAGQTHKAGEYRNACRKAVVYLRKVQSNDGCFGGKEQDYFVYNHAMVTTAMAEICGLTEDAILKPIVDRAVDFILEAQNPGLGWRYGVQPGVNDSSVTGWMVKALATARDAGIEFDDTASFDGAAKWFDLVTVVTDGRPKTGYNKPGSPNARLRSHDQYAINGTMEAIYIKSMLAMEKAEVDDETVAAMAEALAADDTLPVWDHLKIDFYYWYFASRALSEVGGDGLKKWEESTIEVLHGHQRGWHTIDKVSKHTSPDKLDEHGSWDPVGTWGSAGGRVYSTAIGTLTLLAFE